MPVCAASELLPPLALPLLAQALYAADLVGQEEAQGAVDAYAEVRRGGGALATGWSQQRMSEAPPPLPSPPLLSPLLSPHPGPKGQVHRMTAKLGLIASPHSPPPPLKQVLQSEDNARMATKLGLLLFPHPPPPLLSPCAGAAV